jgi:hypothetical protein
MVKFRRRRGDTVNAAEIVKRPCTPSESLAQSLKEMILMRKGQLKKKTWDECRNELDKK